MHEHVCRARCLRLVLVLGLLAGAGVAAADGFSDGRRAYLAGDYARAIAVWKPLAEASHPGAQFGLGTLYHEGAGVAPDPVEATRWFRLAAEQDYAPAQFNLGNAYKHGRGVEQDDQQANAWWLKAAQQGFAPAQYNLGTQYYYGHGVSQDRKRAVELYRAAALNGHDGARRLFDVGGSAAGPAGAAPAKAQATARTVAAEKSMPPGVYGPSWLLEQDPRHYTVQIAALASADAAKEYARHPGVAGELAYFGFSRDGKQLYPVVYGSFPDRAEAERVVAGLPPRLRESRPWIRRFAGIQKTIRGAPRN